VISARSSVALAVIPARSPVALAVISARSPLALAQKSVRDHEGTLIGHASSLCITLSANSLPATAWG
jgi:hypothetical protein